MPMFYDALIKHYGHTPVTAWRYAFYLPGALHQESSGASRARDAARHLAAMGLWKLRSPSLDAEVRVG